MSDVSFSEDAWDEYENLQEKDRRMLKKVNQLIRSIQREGPSNGIGKPERLKYVDGEFWSRRIDKKNRLIYEVSDDRIYITACIEHYDD